MSDAEEIEATAPGNVAVDGHRPNSVLQVAHLVGTHPDSWEDAVRSAIGEAAKTITDLSHAQIVELDTQLGEGNIVRYRARLKVAFRVDRHRVDASGAEVDVRRYLVVANRTIASPELSKAIAGRLDDGPSEFHVLVPATYSRDFATARRLAQFGADPATGYISDVTTLMGDDDEGRRTAQGRLGDRLALLSEVGAEATGEVGDADPMVAIATVLSRSSFDEIILSTLPAGVSRWLGMDLPSRIERRFGLPVNHVGTSPVR